MALTWHEFSSMSAAAQVLANTVADQLRLAIAARGVATLAVPGGNTPIPFFQALSQQVLDWSHVRITLTDDRIVPADHQDSNVRLIQQYLLCGPAQQAQFMPLLDTVNDPIEQIELRLSNLAWPLDLMILGMGEDGHTASLFPDAAEIQQGLTTENYCLRVHPTRAAHARISLSAKALLACRELIVLVQGEKKRSLLREQISLPGSIEELPMRLLIHQTTIPCHVYWST